MWPSLQTVSIIIMVFFLQYWELNTASHMLGKHSTTESHPQPYWLLFSWYIDYIFLSLSLSQFLKTRLDNIT
jgi:hypothetical protein